VIEVVCDQHGNAYTPIALFTTAFTESGWALVIPRKIVIERDGLMIETKRVRPSYEETMIDDLPIVRRIDTLFRNDLEPTFHGELKARIFAGQSIATVRTRVVLKCVRCKMERRFRIETLAPQLDRLQRDGVSEISLRNLLAMIDSS
jgi:hypothetical protein